MSTDYRKALARVLVRKGAVVDVEPSYYGWQDYDATIHLLECGPGRVRELKEDHWHEFTNTFDEGDDSHTGVSATVTCRCDLVKSRQVRYTGTIHQLLAATLELDSFDVTLEEE